MENGGFLNEKNDKKAWILWMEGRVNGEYEAIETPVGCIPEYKDIRGLFKETFNKEYTQEDYTKQFSIRIANYLKKLDRIERIYKDEEDVPEIFYKHLEQQRQRLLDAKKKFGKDVVSPFEFE